MKTLVQVILAGLTAAMIAAASGDIIVYTDGDYDEVKIKNTTPTSFILEGSYGDINYPRERVYSAHRSVPEHPGEEYYKAGLMLLQLHKKSLARKLFEKASTFDARYGQAGASALNAYTPQPLADDGSRLRVDSSGGRYGAGSGFKVQCKLCNGTGKVDYEIQKVFSGSSDSGEKKTGKAIKGTMQCPACSGKGYRILQIGPEEGICPACGGAGSVKEKSDKGSWVFTYVPCSDCGGRGIKPIKMGGTREGIQPVVSPQPQPTTATDDSEMSAKGDDDSDEKKPPPPRKEGLLKYRWYIVAGGGGLLILAFVISKASNKKK